MYTRQRGTVWIIDSSRALVGDYQPVLCNDSNYLVFVVSPLFEDGGRHKHITVDVLDEEVSDVIHCAWPI